MNNATLTPRQARFLDQYLATGCAAKAAVAAGYSPNGAKVTGCRLLTNPNLKRAIEVRRQADATRLSITRENVLQRLLEAFDMAREQREPAAMVAAARELGKMLGFYAPAQARVTVDVAAEAERGRIAALSDAELFGLIAQAEDVASE